jgi:hypothetical protein
MWLCGCQWLVSAWPCSHSTCRAWQTWQKYGYAWSISREMLDLVFYYIGYSQLQQYTIIEQIWIPLVRRQLGYMDGGFVYLLVVRVCVTALGKACAKKENKCPYLYRCTSKARTTTRSWSKVMSSKCWSISRLLCHVVWLTQALRSITDPVCHSNHTVAHIYSYL